MRVKAYLWACLLWIGSGPQATANDIAHCNQAQDMELRVLGCTGFIEAGASGGNLAIALVNRGIAHDALNETGRAIADFDRAIEVMSGFSDGPARRALLALPYLLLDRDH